MNKKFVIFLIILALLAGVAYRYQTIKNSEKTQQAVIMQSMTPKVELMEPFEVETQNVIDAPGRVVAVKSSDVIARIQGMVIQQHYKDGDFVKQDQLLYTIDPKAFKIALDMAKANLESAKAAQYQAQKDFERTDELVKSDFVSKSAYDKALSARDAANAAVKANVAAVNDAERLLSYTQIKAPISGKISLPTVTVGNYLSSPNMVLTKIVSVDPIYVQYSLDSSLYSQLRNDEILPSKNQKQPIKVEVKLPDGTVYSKTGKADFADNAISPTTGSITLRATFPNPDSILIPGDFVNVKVYSNKTLTYLAVPQEAVMQDTDGRFLFVVDENNIAHKRKIETDGQKDNNWLVKSGVSKGEKIVSTGIIKVRDGAPVEVMTKTENETPNEENKEEAKTENDKKE